MRPHILFVLLTALALPAWAADAGNLHAFTPPPGDLSVDFMKQIFGTAADGVSVGGAGTMIAAMMAVLNEAVLFLAMIFVAYTTVIGTINSAHDGVVLGKKMSEIWVPIRTVGGSALLVPLASGFSLIQMGVLWLAMQGVGIADVAWTAGLQAFNVSGTMAPVSLPDARPLAAAILRNETCAIVMNRQYQASGRTDRVELHRVDELPPANDTVEYQSQIQIFAKFHTSTSYVWQSFEHPITAPPCGAIAFEQNKNDKLTNDMTSASRTQIHAAQVAATEAMLTELQPTAQAIADGHQPPPGAIEKAALHYSNAIGTAAKAAVDASPDVANQAFIQHAKTGGWVQAGTWFDDMLRLQDTIQAAANIVPISNSPHVTDTETEEALISYRGSMELLTEYQLDRSASPRQAYESSIQNAKDLRSSDELWRLLGVPFMSALDYITQNIAGANTSPLLQMRATGNAIIDAGWAIKASMFTLMGFSSGKIAEFTVGTVFNITEALKTTTNTVEFLAAGMWGLGMLLAVYLPALPGIIWVIAVIRWLASVAEAVLAAPLMAAFIIHPDGSDTAGRSSPGLQLILSTVMQPILLVIGFTLSALMLYPASSLVNSIFIGMVSGATSGEVVGPITMLGYVSVYTGMMVMVCHACFSLTQAVPDNVMRYVGSQAGAPTIGTQQTEKTSGSLESSSHAAGAAAARGSLGTGSSSNSKKGGERNLNGISNANAPSNDELM